MLTRSRVYFSMKELWGPARSGHRTLANDPRVREASVRSGLERIVGESKALRCERKNTPAPCSTYLTDTTQNSRPFLWNVCFKRFVSSERDTDPQKQPVSPQHGNWKRELSGSFERYLETDSTEPKALFAPPRVESINQPHLRLEGNSTTSSVVSDAAIAFMGLSSTGMQHAPILRAVRGDRVFSWTM